VSGTTQNNFASWVEGWEETEDAGMDGLVDTLSYWNFRVMRRPEPDCPGEYRFSFVEAWYNDNNELISWTEEDCAPEAGSVSDLMEAVIFALEKPVLDEEEEERRIAEKQSCILP